VRCLIEGIVVDTGGLVQHDLFSVDLDGRKEVVLLRRQVVSIQVLGFNVNEARADAR